MTNPVMGSAFLHNASTCPRERCSSVQGSMFLGCLANHVRPLAYLRAQAAIAGWYMQRPRTIGARTRPTSLPSGTGGCTPAWTSTLPR